MERHGWNLGVERHEAESVMGEAWSLISEGERHEVESVRGKDMKWNQ